MQPTSTKWTLLARRAGSAWRRRRRRMSGMAIVLFLGVVAWWISISQCAGRWNTFAVSIPKKEVGPLSLRKQNDAYLFALANGDADMRRQDETTEEADEFVSQPPVQASWLADHDHHHSLLGHTDRVGHARHLLFEICHGLGCVRRWRQHSLRSRSGPSGFRVDMGYVVVTSASQIGVHTVGLKTTAFRITEAARVAILASKNPQNLLFKEQHVLGNASPDLRAASGGPSPVKMGLVRLLSRRTPERRGWRQQDIVFRRRLRLCHPPDITRSSRCQKFI